MNENTIMVSVLVAVVLVSVAGLYMTNEPNMITGGQVALSDVNFFLNDLQFVETSPPAINLQVTLGEDNIGVDVATGPGGATCTPTIGVDPCNVVVLGGNTITLSYGGNIPGKIVTYSDSVIGSGNFITTPAAEIAPPLGNPDCNKAPVLIVLGTSGGKTTILDMLAPGTTSGVYVKSTGISAAGNNVLTVNFEAQAASGLC